jgi:hypothetical protein
VGIAARGAASGVYAVPGTLEANKSRGGAKGFIAGLPRQKAIQETVSATTWKTIIGKAATSTMGEIGAVAASEEK